MAALAAKGYTVLLPIGDGHRYDLVLDTPEGFKRVQCKTAFVSKDGANLRYKAYSQSFDRKSTYRYTAEEADLFAVYCPKLDTVYLVPHADASGGLRLSTKIQHPGTKWAKDFQI